MTNTHLYLSKLSQFYCYYLSRSREYSNLLISTTLIHLFMTPVLINPYNICPFVTRSIVWYSKSHKLICFAFSTTSGVGRSTASLPASFYSVTEPNNTEASSRRGLVLVIKEGNAVIYDLDYRGRSFWRNGEWLFGTSQGIICLVRTVPPLILQTFWSYRSGNPKKPLV